MISSVREIPSGERRGLFSWGKKVIRVYKTLNGESKIGIERVSNLQELRGHKLTSFI